MKSQELSTYNLPDSPGVYYFLGPKKEILYVGKATSLKDRVKSYFGKDLINTRGPLLVKMVEESIALDYSTTDSVLEALMCEALQIKKHTPPYNSAEKDNKSFQMVVITDEDFPRIITVRARNLTFWKKEKANYKPKYIFGPFPHAGELREALKIIRRIFPYRDEKCKLTGKPCFNTQIGLCPGVCAGWMSKVEYRKRVRRIKLFFEGKKDVLIKDLEKEMRTLAKAQKFEEASKLKRTIYALEHIQDVALIKRDMERVNADAFRIEAYDIAHLGGKEVVGVMTVVIDGELAKDQYRKFKIKVDKNDDVNSLKEVLSRRLNHSEWSFPNLVVVDGGLAQMNAAQEVLRERGLAIEAVSVLKDEHHKAKKVLGESLAIKDWGRSILVANSEAHRFAIGYHRKLRNKGFRI
jgi:excinuclease ABC subunit C